MTSAEKRRKIQRMVKALGRGTGIGELARREGYAHACGAINYLKRNAPDVYRKFRKNHTLGGKPVPREEAIKRLKLGLLIEAAGVNAEALAKWLKTVAPHGCADALLDYEDDPE